MTPAVPTDDFRALFDVTFDDLWRFARRRCATAEDADDVTAQVFAVAWRRWADVPAGHEARLWLFGVCRRVLANERRSIARRDRLRRRLVAAASVFRADESALDRDPHEAVRDAIAGLREADRLIVTMRYWEELGVDEMATVLGATPNAVSIRLHRARRRLADQLGGLDTRLGTKDNNPDGHVVTDGTPREGVEP